ncbi:WD40 repeat domain-containing protein [Pyxidicoccus xibeiensis]|uniref:WD40 repeat domain-containing protein n=1 Tax=Pyxidicoccus xibeiensis TaxID=2906759 RepID=UPI0020A833B6|nr:transcriptional regulator [Pyxidicoccus xibeiensis]MCP3138588.1 transcriptional regulator [Pyxidicoccus xibeiensis]
MWRRYRQELGPEHDFEDPLGPPLLWPDGRHVAANGRGRIFLWDLATGACSRVLQSSAICRDGDPSFRLACEPVLGRVLEAHKLRDFAVWDSVEWRRIQTFAGHGEPVQAATFVTDDRILSISGDSTAQLWDAWTGERLRMLDTPPLYALAKKPASGHVAVCGSGGAVIVLDGPTLDVRASFHLPMVAARHGPLSEERKRQVGIVWNRPSNTLQALAWHPDGEHLICGAWDFVPRMFHSGTGRVVREWHGHSHWVDAVAVEPSRGLLVTGSSDGTVRVWSLHSTECLAVHDVGHANVEGLLLHDGAIYVTCQGELLVIPLPAE